MLTEGAHAAEFLISEANGARSRENIVILGGVDPNPRVLTAGMVLGRRLTGSATATANAGNTGTGAVGTITVAGAVKQGIYRVIFIEPATNAGVFEVEDPDGIPLGQGNVGAVFAKGGLSFTIADATDFVAGDGFAIQVTNVAAKWLQYDPAGTLGEQVAAGILRADVTAPVATDVPAVAFVRDCEININEILFPNVGITVPLRLNAIAQLKKQGIILRGGEGDGLI